MAEFHQLPSLKDRNSNLEWNALDKSAEERAKKAPTADLPSLSHLTLQDYDQVYEPSDDSYLFIDALQYEFDQGNLRPGEHPFVVLEIGCGSGVISVFFRSQWAARFGKKDDDNSRANESHELQSIVTDVNTKALQVALETDRMNNNDNNQPSFLSAMEALHCDLATPLLSRWAHQVDVILFNPPYVPTSDEEVGAQDISAAWAGGVDGRRVVDRAVPQIHQLLRPGRGVAYLVTVDDNRPPQLAELFRQQSKNAQHEPVLEMKPLFRRRARNEYLSIQKISWSVPARPIQNRNDEDEPPQKANAAVEDGSPDDSEQPGKILILLVCGLPASGKSQLAKSLKERIDEEASTSPFRECHHIEYDNLQEEILKEKRQQQAPTETNTDDDDAIVAWRESRAVALDQLKDLLQKESQLSNNNDNNGKCSNSRNVLIIMDDNFHLRSMRKQVFQICQEHARQTSKDTSTSTQPDLVFSSLWLDAPIECCMERNASRPPSSRVSNETIQKLHATAELPTLGRATWEVNMMKLDSKDGKEDLAVLVGQTYDFVKTLASVHEVEIVRPQPTAAEEEERLERERSLTLANKSNQFDQASRQWVGAVARIKPKDAKVANQIRKDMVKELQQKRNQDGLVDLPKLFGSRVWGSSDREWTEEEKEQLLAQLSLL